MLATKVLRAAGGRTPLIQFPGKRSIPESIDHTPRLHSQDPHKSLPSSFAEYRVKAQQHGPLTGYRSASSTSRPMPKPLPEGERYERSELPKRFWSLPFSKAEIRAIEDGTALA